MEQLIGSGLRKENDRAVCCHPVYLTYPLSTSWKMEGWMLQAGIKIGRRNINNLRYAGDTTLIAESKDELKNLLMTVKEESERTSLKLNIKKTKIMACSPISSWQIEGENVEVVIDFLFLGSKNHCGQWLQPWNQKMIASWQESYDKPRQCVENQKHYSAYKCLYSQGCGLPSGHVQLRELGRKEYRTPKIWCFWTVVLEKTPESPLDSKEIKQLNQPWILVETTDAEVEAPEFWSSDANIRLIEKFSDTGKDWGQEEKRVSEDEMAGWRHWFNGHEFGQTLEMMRDREA